MSNWSRRNEEKEFVRKKKQTTVELMAKYFLDISKLVFAALVLGGFTPLLGDERIEIFWPSIIGGGLVSLVFAIMGYRILK